jgi:hypothetical protein
VSLSGTGALNKAECEFDLDEFFGDSGKDEWASKLLKNRDRLAAICRRRLLSGFEQDLLPGGGSLVGPDHPMFYGVRPARFDPIFPPGRAPPSRYGDEPSSRYGDEPPSRYGDEPPSRYGDEPPSRYGDEPPSRYGDALPPPGFNNSIHPSGFHSFE